MNDSACSNGTYQSHETDRGRYQRLQGTLHIGKLAKVQTDRMPRSMTKIHLVCGPQPSSVLSGVRISAHAPRSRGHCTSAWVEFSHGSERRSNSLKKFLTPLYIGLQPQLANEGSSISLARDSGHFRTRPKCRSFLHAWKWSCVLDPIAEFSIVFCTIIVH